MCLNFKLVGQCLYSYIPYRMDTGVFPNIRPQESVSVFITNVCAVSFSISKPA